jgi:hypothetical protein
MTTSPLRDARLKLERADRHLAEFRSVFARYFDSRPLTLTQGLDAAASQWVVRAKIEREFPDEAGTVVGDIAHNIRSSLDALVWELARLQTATPGRTTQFPIFTRATDFRTTGRRRMIADLASEHADFIERLQPYHAEDVYADPLFILNRLSNVDKHRHIHLAETALTGASLRITGFQGGIGLGGMTLSFGSIRDGAELARIDVHSDATGDTPSMNVEIQGAFDLAVDDEGSQLSVAAGLEYAREFTGDIVDWFSPVFRS